MAAGTDNSGHTARLTAPVDVEPRLPLGDHVGVPTGVPTGVHVKAEPPTSRRYLPCAGRRRTQLALRRQQGPQPGARVCPAPSPPPHARRQRQDHQHTKSHPVPEHPRTPNPEHRDPPPRRRTATSVGDQHGPHHNVTRRCTRRTPHAAEWLLGRQQGAPTTCTLAAMTTLPWTGQPPRQLPTPTAVSGPRPEPSSPTSSTSCARGQAADQPDRPCGDRRRSRRTRRGNRAP